MSAIAELMPRIGLSHACRAFALNRGFVYRERHRRRPSVSRRVRRGRARPPLAFSIAEQELLLGLLSSERFLDMAPAAVFATLLDEGQYVCVFRARKASDSRQGGPWFHTMSVHCA